MTFVADESVGGQIVEAVRGLGYEVVFIAETAPGIDDQEVLRRAESTGAVLLTIRAHADEFAAAFSVLTERSLRVRRTVQ